MGEDLELICMSDSSGLHEATPYLKIESYDTEGGGEGEGGLNQICRLCRDGASTPEFPTPQGVGWGRGEGNMKGVGWGLRGIIGSLDAHILCTDF